MVTHSDDKETKVETEPIRLRVEDIAFIEKFRLSQYEPFYAIASRVLDKAKQFDKKVKG